MGNNIAKEGNDNEKSIISYNINLKYFSPIRIEKFTKFLLKSENTIFCIQELHDEKSLEYIKKNIKKSKLKLINCNSSFGLYIITDLDYINCDTHTFECNSDVVNNIDTKKKGIVVINLKLEDYILSVYNICLQENLKYIMKTDDIRKGQFGELETIVRNNSIKLKKTFNDCNIHFITGSYNIDTNRELEDNLKNYGFINLYNIDEKSYVDEDKTDYILLYSDIIEHKGEGSFKVKCCEDCDLILNISNLEVKYNITYSNFYPIEITFDAKKIIA